MLGSLIKSGRFKLTTECPKTYESIKDYKWVDLTPMQRAQDLEAPERPQKTNDHLTDCAQYVSAVQVGSPMRPMRREPKTMDEEIHQAIKKQLIDRQNVTPDYDPGTIV